MSARPLKKPQNFRKRPTSAIVNGGSKAYLESQITNTASKNVPSTASRTNQGSGSFFHSSQQVPAFSHNGKGVPAFVTSMKSKHCLDSESMKYSNNFESLSTALGIIHDRKVNNSVQHVQ